MRRTPYSAAALQPASDRRETSSARTTTPKRVSPPSSSGRPPRSRMLQHPSQRRARSGCNCGELGATEGRRRRAFDPDVDQVTCGGGPGEVDGRVPPRPAAQERRVRPARPLDEHLLDETYALLVAIVRDPLDDLDEPLDPLALHLLRNLIGHRR